MNKLAKLQIALASYEEELANCGKSKPQFMIDDDDEYQDQLELGWHKSELIDKIDALRDEIQELEGAL